MSLQLKVIDSENDRRWDEFVLRHPLGMIYHHSSWGKVLKATFGYEPFYVALERSESGEFEGILPFLLIKSKLTGKRLVSLPFTSYCSRLMPESELENIVNFVYDHHPDADYLEVKLLEKAEISTILFEKKPAYTTHILHIDKDIGQIFKSFHNTSIRQTIKRAEKNDLQFRITDMEEDLEKFYTLEIMTRKKHGLPPHPYSFFSNMWQELRKENFLIIPLIEYHDKVIAAAVVLRFKDTFHFEYHASDQNYHRLFPNQKLIWQLIKMAHREGARYFDFGRTSLINRSLIVFKERWGAKEQLLPYYYYPKAIKVNRDNGIARQILGFINRFLPPSVLRIEGKLIYPHLG